MSTSVPPIPQQAAPAGLSEPQRIINTFTAPSKTFADIRRNASWWVPWLLVGIALGASAFLFNKKIDLEQFMRDQIANSSFQARAFEGMTKEQQDKAVARGIKVTKLLPYAFPIFSLIGGLIIAAVLMACFNFIHEAAVPYSRSLAIFYYAGLPSLIAAALAIISLVLASDAEGKNPRNLVATNPAYFMDYQTTSKFVYGMVGSLDVITIWVIILIGIGFKVNSAKPKMSTGSAVGTVFALYIVWRLIASGFGWV